MCVRYCVLKSITFHVDHYTVHIRRGGKFTIGCVTTNRRTLLSLESKQSNTYHCTVFVIILAKFTNYCLLLCRISYILPYLFVYCLSDLKLRITRPTMCSQLLSAGSRKILDQYILYVLECNLSFLVISALCRVVC